jgi:uncharacterized protein YbjT (DUF2867 family)
MILVSGATGTIGSEVTRLLSGRAEAVRVMTRNPYTATFPNGIEVVRGDFDESDSLRASAEGVTTVFLLTAPGDWVPRHDKAMLDAAVAAGVTKVVKLSAIGADTTKGSWHLPGEEALQAGGLAWTILRPAGFMSNALGWAQAIRAGQPVANRTGTGAQSPIDPRDVAEVAVKALLSAEHDGRIYTLTGPECLSVPDQVAQLADALGHAVETIDIDIEEARRQMLDAGIHPSVVAVAVAGQEYVRAGHAAVLTGDAERVLNRPPRTFRDWAHDHFAAFRS